jgi:hypothetical protein
MYKMASALEEISTMINESALSYKRGDLVEFQLRLGGGPKRCRGLVLNTAVLFGRAARQLWILDMDDPTPQLEAAWTRRKHIVHEEDIIALIPSTVIGRDTLLRDNPVCYPVQDGRETLEIPAVTVSVALPVLHPVATQSDAPTQGDATAEPSSKSESTR